MYHLPIENTIGGGNLRNLSPKWDKNVTLFNAWKNGQTGVPIIDAGMRQLNTIDYDVASNNGNWQWNSGIGADRSGYLRIFNPYKQAIEHDSQCIYIKRWIPELNSIPNKDILQWEKTCLKYPNINYPQPILDFSTRRAEAMMWIKE